MRRAMALTLAAAALLSGCKTNREPMPEGAVTPGTVVPFAPARVRAPIQYDTGRYATLFTNDSYALWVDAAVSAARLAEAQEAGAGPDPRSATRAATLDAAFQVFECRLDSLFADGAIAYDVVGLYGVDVYLETSDGRVIRPARTAAGSLEEGRKGALLHFSRTVLVGFPRDQFRVTVGAGETRGASVRLVIEGHGTKFYFEWFSVMPEVYLDGRAIQRKKVEAAKMSFKTYYAKVRAWAHNFD